MKIRTGFVSNSSSSSFCIYGACLDIDKIKEKVKADDSKDEDPDIDAYDEAEKLFPGYKVTYGPEDSEGLYVGKEWSDIKDDETGKQFKENIEKKIKEVFGEDIECSTLEETWRDG